MAEHPPRDDRKKAHEAKGEDDDKLVYSGVGPEGSSLMKALQSNEEVWVAGQSIKRHGLDLDLSDPPLATESSIPAIERIPFDPHSVLSVDESNLNASQYAVNPEMQTDMNALSAITAHGASEDSNLDSIPEDWWEEHLKEVARNELETDVQEQINRNKKTRTRGEFVAGAGERVTEDIPMTDGTPKEWKQKLRELVGKFGEGAKEKTTGGAERMKAYLSGRLGELDMAIAAKTEKGFRSLGEWYGKLGWKSKLAVGLSLGIGMGVSAAAGASIPAALGLVFTGAGIGAQRIAGLSAMFLKYEKSTQNGKWKKEKAMGKAILYTAGMTGAMMLLVEGVKEAINFADQSHKDEAILRWIGSMTGNKTLAPDAAPAGSGVPAPAAPIVEAPPAAAPEVGGSHEVAGKISSATAPGAIAPATVEMPSVKASAGHGYEYMMKRLWENLHAKGVELPANANPDSDLARLLAADEDSIDKLVHDLAADSKHQFFRADGSSVLIAPDAQMTIGARGELFLSDAAHELQVAPAHMAATHAASGAPHIEAPMMVTPSGLDPYFIPPQAEPLAPAVASPDPHLGTQSAAPQEINPLTGIVNEQTPAQGAVPGQNIEQSAAQVPSDPTIVRTGSGGTLVYEDESGAHPVHTGSYEAPPGINTFGINVSIDTPHIYTDSGAESKFVFGGSISEQANVIKQYLAANPNSVVYGTDETGSYRVPFYMLDGKVSAGPPVRTGGFFGWFSSWMKAPSPDEFAKIIK